MLGFLLCGNISTAENLGLSGQDENGVCEWTGLKQSAMVDSAEREGLKLRIDEMRQFLDEQTESITEYDEQLTRRLIEKITVYEDHFTIEFKSGTSMEIHR